ncbi:MAG: HlyD family secretion protein [Alphaproteobacteria bacterium]|nr:HlyD family secretion protein [Alphaproteobacteria bacterium]
MPYDSVSTPDRMIQRAARRISLKRIGVGAALVAALMGSAGYGHHYWTVARFLESTDDAYLKADYTTVAPKVSGYISDVLVQDNQAVRAGQLLARIDDRDFQTALAQAKADVAAAEAEIRNLAAQIELQNSLVAQAEASLASSQAAMRFARTDAARFHTLRQQGFASVEKDDQAETSVRQTTAAVQHDQAALAAARQQIDVLQTQRAKAETLLAHNRAVEAQAQLNLGYTTITAPIDGTVGARSLRAGQYVQAGTALMAVVPLDAVYVVANFKETQLTHVRAGEPARLAIDTFPGAAVNGRVDSLSPASGLEFALLPPDNATGNFTKIVQRIPVKIVISANDPLIGRLRPGMSVVATIDTKPAPAATTVAENQP